jgi:cysteine desulfurase
MDLVYLDNNATTPLLPSALEAMRPFFSGKFGNPASAHSAGRQARRALEDARERLADLLQAFPDEVVFTSGATEANNLALFGLVHEPAKVVLASPVEHPSVTEPLNQLGLSGMEIQWLPVDAVGSIPADVAMPAALQLVCVQLANHETGAIHPIAALASRLTENIPFHCDAVQAVGKVAVRFRDLGVTTMALSAHKFHGPKGIGALLVRRGCKLRPRTWGGHQQAARRPGTEPVALIVGMVTALEAAERDRETRWAHILEMRRHFLGHLQAHAAPVSLNGPATGGLPHTINVSFPGLAADALLMNFDLAGVACSTGSACSSGSLLPSPVLQAMRTPEDRLRSAMRFSLSPLLEIEDVHEGAVRVANVVQRLRQGSLHWNFTPA